MILVRPIYFAPSQCTAGLHKIHADGALEPQMMSSTNSSFFCGSKLQKRIK